MQIQVINVAQKMPDWVEAGCADYARRLPRELGLSLVTVPLASARSQQSAASRRDREATQILTKLRPGSLSIALDDAGKSWTSADWAAQLQRWMHDYTQVNLIIGGPDGLSAQCLEACQQRVSLGRMTMPHTLVKVVLLEQLYRAWSIHQGHPYHRD
jgi:23S rRNA (pseudouridine1915-N3)-methyltransferase